MAIKVKEMQLDATMQISVNRNFYMMTKALSFYLYQQVGKTDSDEYLKEIMTKPYAELDDLQRSFYTVALLLAEMEAEAKANNLYDEKEVLEPGDEGYVAPKLD